MSVMIETLPMPLGEIIDYGSLTVDGTEDLVPVANVKGKRARYLILHNTHATEKVAFGKTGVAYATGMIIEPLEKIVLSVTTAMGLYMISDGTAVDVRYMWLGE